MIDFITNKLMSHFDQHFTQVFVIVRRAGLLWSQQDFEWRWSVPLFKCLTVLEFSFILFDLCLLITFFNFIMNYVPIVTFWIFTYHKIWILSIMFCSIWSYWIIYFLYVMSWQYFLHLWPFVRGKHQPLMDFTHKGPQMQSFNICFAVSFNCQLQVLTLKGPIPYIYGTQVWLSLCLQMS